jgi:SSS family solute:Na+ symporter
MQFGTLNWLIVGTYLVGTLLIGRILDGRQTAWHQYSVPGQRLHFAREDLPEMHEGWHVAPGRIDWPVWWLLVWFALIVLFLAYFLTLG